MPNPKTRAERLGLTTLTVTGEDAAAIDERIESAWRLHVGFGCERLSVEHLAERVRTFGRDCYYQGLLDGSNPLVADKVRELRRDSGDL